MYYIFDDCGNCLFYAETKSAIEAVFGSTPDDSFIYDFSITLIPKDTPMINEFNWY